jgi:hypothetical protein
MKTKPFESFFGTKEVTKDDYVRRWLESTHQYASLFYGINQGQDLIEFQSALIKAAETAWDKQ